jgi:hypothetical protein
METPQAAYFEYALILATPMPLVTPSNTFHPFLNQQHGPHRNLRNISRYFELSEDTAPDRIR